MREREEFPQGYKKNLYFIGIRNKTSNRWKMNIISGYSQVTDTNIFHTYML